MAAPLSRTWLRVPPSSAAVLRHWFSTIPTSDEVVVSNGVAGRFADRPYIYVVMDPEAPVPLFGRPVYFVRAGVPTEPREAWTEAQAAAARLGPAARVVDARAGVEIVYWSPPAGQRQLTSAP